MPEQELFPVETPDNKAAKNMRAQTPPPSSEDENDLDPDCPDRGGEAL